MLAESLPLKAGQPSQSGKRVLAALAAFGALACLAGTLIAISPRATVLETSVDVNCDGSVDITTDELSPCLPGIMPAAGVYPSYAPALFAPPAAVPTVAAPQVVAPAGIAPVGYNSYQMPTVWSGDHVLSGGQPEWAAEDAAQHALNLANWRIKLLEAKRRQAELSNQVLDISTHGTHLEGEPFALEDEPVVLEDESPKAELDGIKKSLSTLASDTNKAIGDLDQEIRKNNQRKSKTGSSLRRLEDNTDAKLGKIMRQLDELSKDYDA